MSLRVGDIRASSLTLPALPFWFPVAVIKHGPKATSSLQLPGHTPSLRELGAGIWRQALKQRPQRSGTHWLAPHGLLRQPRFTCLDIPLARVGRSPFTSITNPENAPTDLTTGQFDGSNFSIEDLWQGQAVTLKGPVTHLHQPALLKPPKTVPPAGDQIFKHTCLCGTSQIKSWLTPNFYSVMVSYTLYSLILWPSGAVGYVTSSQMGGPSQSFQNLYMAVAVEQCLS